MAATATQAMENLAKTAENVYVDLDQLFVNTETNVREDYDADELAELKSNIEAVGGILTPIHILKLEPTEATEFKEYALVSGFRRVMCLRELAEEDPEYGENIRAVIIRPASESGMKVAQLIENMQRSDLKPLEKAWGMKEALKEKQFSQKELSRLLGVTETAVSQHLKLLDLPDTIKDMLDEEEITFSHARVIMYSVPQDQWMDAAKIAKSLTIGEFTKRMEARYSSKKDEGEETSTDGTSTQRSPQVRRAARLTNVYLPFFKQQAKEAKSDKEKHDWQTRLDTARWFLKEEDTELEKLCKPFEEELEQKEKEEEEAKQAESAKKTFVKDLLKEMRSLVKEMPKEGEKRRTLPENLAIIRKKVEDAVAKHQEVEEKGDSASDFEKETQLLGFELPDVDKFMEEFGQAYHDDVKAREEAKEKRRKKKEEEEKKKKEEEAKKKADKKTEKADASPGDKKS